MGGTFKGLSVAVILVAVVACTSGPTPDEVIKADPIPYVLDQNGVQLVGRSQRIDFGRTDHSAERAMNKLVGQPAISREICPDGSPVVVWVDGTKLYFIRGAFRGWSKHSVDGTRLVQAGKICA